MREDLTNTAQEAVNKAGVAKDAPYTPNKIEVGRLFKIMSEFVAGFNLIKKYCLAVTVFGTARCSFEDEVYQKARALGKGLAEDGFTVISGG